MLDAAALYLALAQDEAPEETHQCVQSGIVALGKLGRLAQNPRGGSPEQVRGIRPTSTNMKGTTRMSDEVTGSKIALPFHRFQEAYEYLRGTEFPVLCSVEEAWITFSGWRTRYEANAYALNDFTVAVPASWSGPRRHMTRREAYEVIMHPTRPPEPANNVDDSVSDAERFA